MGKDQQLGQDIAAVHLNSLLASNSLSQIEQGLIQTARLPLAEAAPFLTVMVTANQSEAASEMIGETFRTLGNTLRLRNVAGQEHRPLETAETQALEGFFQGVQGRLVKFRRHPEFEEPLISAFTELLSAYPETAVTSSGLTAELLRSDNYASVGETIKLVAGYLPLEQALTEFKALAGNKNARNLSVFSPTSVRTITARLNRRGTDLTQEENQALSALLGEYAKALPRILQYSHDSRGKEEGDSADELTKSLAQLIDAHPESSASAETLLTSIAQSNSITSLNEITKLIDNDLPFSIASRLVITLAGNQSKEAVSHLGTVCAAMVKNLERNHTSRDNPNRTEGVAAEAQNAVKSLRDAATRSKKIGDSIVSFHLEKLLQIV